MPSVSVLMAVSADAKMLIQAQGIELTLGQNRILSHIDFSIRAGEIVTIVGPNGSGKSSLLRVLVGAIQATDGNLVVASGLRVGYVPQRLDLERALPMSVRRFFNLPRKVSTKAVSEVCQRISVEHLLDQPMIELSGGQMQRVLLARAVLNHPDILVLDEATQGLDQQGSAQFYQQIESLRNEMGCAVLMVSHELHVVMSASDRVICLNGHVCCEGAPDVVSSKPEYRALFGTGTQGTLALYRHEHDHTHDHAHDHDHNHDHSQGHLKDHSRPLTRPLARSLARSLT